MYIYIYMKICICMYILIDMRMETCRGAYPQACHCSDAHAAFQIA